MTNKEAIRILKLQRERITPANGELCQALDLAIEALEEAPTVDTTCPNCDSGYAQGYSDGYLKGKEERPTGEWIEDSGNIACSHCYTIWLYRKTDFCPNCGAKMKRGDKE